MPNARLALASFIVLAAFHSARPAVAEDGGTKKIPVERSPVVKKQGYFPVALRLVDGRIAIVMRGGAPHLGIKGRLDMVYSSDEGKTWTSPSVVVDSPADDRNPALGQAASGAIVVGFYRTETYDEAGKYLPKSEKPVGTWVTRSEDNGATWQEPSRIDVADIGWGSPYGRMVTLADGSMLMAIYGGTIGGGPPIQNNRNHSYVYRSTDDGKTWKRLSEPGAGYTQFNETSLLATKGGGIVAAMRSRAGEVWMTRSRDQGLTWDEPKRITPVSVHPGDLCELPDGRMLLTVGDRLQDFGVRGMIGSAEQGFDWEKRFTLIDDSVSKDCGYPSSVVLKDGRVLTAYYSTAAKDHRDWEVHCGAVVFRP